MTWEQYISIKAAGGGGGFTVTATVSDLEPVYGDTATLSVTSPTVTLTGATWYVDGIQVATGTSTTWDTTRLYGPQTMTCVATDGTGYGEDDVAIDVKVAPYVRPADWLDIDSLVSPGDEKIVALFAVFDSDSNRVAFRCTGAYQVDWGDGTVTSYASGVVAEHAYSYASLSASTDTTRGYRQAIITITPQAGQSLLLWQVQSYRYTGVTWNYMEAWLDIKMSVPNMTICDIKSGATLMYMCEKLVWIGPTAMTNHTTRCSGWYGLQHLELPPTTSYNQAFINCKSLAYFDHDFSLATNVQTAFQGSGLRYADYDLASTTNTTNLFFSCTDLLNAKIVNANGPCTQMFRSCNRLEKVDFSGSPTLTNEMFNGCTTLLEPPNITVDLITNASGMFINCSSLRTTLAGTFSVCTNMNTMYSGCNSIVYITPFYMGACQNASLMFNACNSLKEVPLLDTSAVTNNVRMLDACSALTTVAALDFSSVTRWGQPNTGAFTSCVLVQFLPTFDCVSTTTDTYGLYRAFQNMNNLIRLDLNNTGAITGWQEFVRSCFALTEIGPMDMSSGTNFTAAFVGCYNLRRMQGTGIKVTVSFNQCQLDATAIDEIFTNLAVVAGQTITVSQNPGSSTCTPSIATTKGWTVVT